jgi:hypothetical protein
LKHPESVLIGGFERGIAEGFHVEAGQHRSLSSNSDVVFSLSVLRRVYLGTGPLSVPEVETVRSRIANNVLAGGVVLFIVGILLIAFSPTNLHIFTYRITGPTGPVGTAISLIGLGLAVAGGYYQRI